MSTGSKKGGRFGLHQLALRKGRDLLHGWSAKALAEGVGGWAESLLNTVDSFLVNTQEGLRSCSFGLGMSDNAIMELNLPTGIPIVYELDNTLKPTKPMRFLGDEETVKKAMEAVAAQGKAK